MEIAPGAVIDRIRLVERIAEGGTSSVWAAFDEVRGQEVAVKFLSRDVTVIEPGWRDRLAREATIGARIESRNVVEIFGHGATPQGDPYIVMELLEGIDVARAIEAGGPLTLAEARTILDQVATVLDRAHDLGIVHRDIKPDNLYLVSSDELVVKVLDFGIAKMVGPGADSLGRTSSRRGPKTRSGVVLGTPEFMSPEQSISSSDVDFRTDLFSLGMVLYFALTGELPFPHGESPSLWRRVEQGPTPVRRTAPSLPAALDDWFGKALALEPEDRFQTAREMCDAFDAAVGPGVAEAPATSRFGSMSLLEYRPSRVGLAAQGQPAVATARDGGKSAGGGGGDEPEPESVDNTQPSYDVAGHLIEPGVRQLGGPNALELSTRPNERGKPANNRPAVTVANEVKTTLASGRRLSDLVGADGLAPPQEPSESQAPAPGASPSVAPPPPPPLPAPSARPSGGAEAPLTPTLAPPPDPEASASLGALPKPAPLPRLDAPARAVALPGLDASPRRSEGSSRALPIDVMASHQALPNLSSSALRRALDGADRTPAWLWALLLVATLGAMAGAALGPGVPH